MLYALQALRHPYTLYLLGRLLRAPLLYRPYPLSFALLEATVSLVTLIARIVVVDKQQK